MQRSEADLAGAKVRSQCRRQEPTTKGGTLEYFRCVRLKAKRPKLSRVQKRAYDCPHHPEERRRVANVYAPDPQWQGALQAFHGQLRELAVHLINRTKRRR